MQGGGLVGERLAGLGVVAGQGGSGIETAPAAAALAAAVLYFELRRVKGEEPAAEAAPAPAPTGTPAL